MKMNDRLKMIACPFYDVVFVCGFLPLNGTERERDRWGVVINNYTHSLLRTSTVIRAFVLLITQSLSLYYYIVLVLLSLSSSPLSVLYYVWYYENT